MTSPTTTVPAGARSFPLRVMLVALARVVLAVAGLVVLYLVVPVRKGSAADGAVVWAGLLALAVFGIAFLTQLRRILHATHPMVTAVESLVCVLAVFIVGFALVHLALSEGDPSAYSEPLNRIGALYFTVTVMSTVGFGDITPVTDSARVVAMIQMLSGLGLIAVTLRVIFGVARRADQRLQSAGSQDT